MTDQDSFKWPTEEEWNAFVALRRDGHIKPIVKLLKANGNNVHHCLFDALEDLDHWDNSLDWIIAPTPKESLPKRKGNGRPAQKDIDPFYDFKLSRLAQIIGQVHIDILEKHKRLPKKVELRNAVLADENLSKLLRFDQFGRTRQDAIIREAQEFLMNLKVSQNP